MTGWRLLFCLLPALAWAGEADFDYHLASRQVADGVHVFAGCNEDFTVANGGNIVNTGYIASPEGAIVIDTGPSRRYGEQMRRAIARPVLRVFNTHHHPDHFLGNQAFADVPIAALEGTGKSIAAEGNAFAENLYRLSGDWLAGTEVQAPNSPVAPGRVDVGGRRLRLIALAGHTGADLAIYDEASGVLFAGDLVFNGRAPTTPHADVPRWLAALDELEAITREPGFRALVPGHGEVTRDGAPIRQTRDWLHWLSATMAEAAADGLDMNEVLARPLPARFSGMALGEREYRRSVGHLFPAAEAAALAAGGKR